ncbi:GntP family permease [Natrinema salifodinae]|uniref:Gluconate:H+ symporter, GntP family/Gnt-I system low-affinity gluconate transporter n=1 Tax=Natrinema salifodinae TaxID=1202768 RepID=A0A1I0QU31_9EURY|nr:SLC13 family permease [Natrinema salifodinae]SEW31148.1 gluconate:H+ symporter, GntP family/Gnt-I system low-affinity gluconate transporter [Natrinema salifodinae]
MVGASILAANIGIAVAIVLLLIIVLDINPAVSLIVGALYMGIASGLGLNETVASIGAGFGDLMQGIGIPIIFGIMIGMLLARCGGATQIATTLTAAVPSRYVPYALGLSGAIVAVPVFFDVAFLVLIPMVIALWQETDLSYPVVIGSLVIGAAGAHTFVPPTPNPLAAPELLEFGLGEMMVAGLVVGFPAVALAIAVYVRVVERLWDREDDIAEIPFEEADDARTDRPSFVASLLPIATPIFLILLQTTAEAVTGEPNVYLDFLGSRIIALLAGLVIAIGVYVRTVGPDDLSDAFSDATRPAGLVLTITGAGGAFGYVIQETQAADALVELIGVSGDGVVIVLLAFAIGLVMRVSQGSGTVAGITAMTIMGGVETTVAGSAIALASLSGGMSIGHINDSGFWVVTELSGLEVTGGLKTYTLSEAILSAFGLVGAIGIAVVA